MSVLGKNSFIIQLIFLSMYSIHSLNMIVECKYVQFIMNVNTNWTDLHIQTLF